MLVVDRPLDTSVLEKARAFYGALPSIAPGLVTHISLHWSATKYGWAVDLAAAGSPIPYNVVADVDAAGNVILVTGMDPRNNARDIGQDEVMDVTYCASCWHRNSHGIAASISALENAGPADFGPYPLSELLVDSLCAGAAALCAKYGVDASNQATCFTHAEAAIWDGYFWGDPTPDGITRGDLCILEAHPEMSTAQLKANAPLVGNLLRSRIHEYKVALLTG
jgi:hypothetical protein